MAVSANLKAIISVVDRVTGPMKNINRALRGPIKAMQDVATAGRNVAGGMASAVGPAAGIAGILGGGGAAFGIGKLLEVGSQFEKFQNILEVVEGSSEKARASMAWVREFAKTTPYQLAEVTDAFVRLKAYGLDPTNGLMKAAGDAASAMGKPLEQAVEAVADAVRGQNERLLEMGIVGEKVGNTMVYRWDKDGKAMVTHAQNNSAAIQKAIIGIWGAKFDGAMRKQSESFEGILSNIADSVTDFFKTVDDQGIFNAAKEELRGIQGLIASWEADGTLQAVAVAISGALTSALAGLKKTLVAIDWKAAWDGAKRFAGALMAGIDAIGGWGNALILLAVIMNAQTIVAVLELVSAIGRIAPALAMAFGVGLGPVLIAIAGIAALAGILIANWSSVGPWFGRLFGSLGNIIGGFTKWLVAVFTGDWGGATEAGKQVLQGLTDFMTTMLDGWLASWGYCIKWITNLLGVDLGAALGSLGDKLPDWAKKMLGLDGTSVVVTAVNGASAPGQAAVQAANTNVPQEAIAAANTNIPPASLVPPVGQLAAPSTSPAIALAAAGKPLTGEIKVTFDNAPPGMRVSQGQTNYPGLALNPSAGYRSMRIAG